MGSAHRLAMTSVRRYARCVAVSAVLAGTCLHANANSGTVYYRYLNEQGVQVMDSSIPPKYAQNGYEIVSLSGEVLKKVDPAPGADDRARREAEEKLREAYNRLSRRYSSIADMEAAKQRKLDDIDTNIAIVSGNISGLEAQIRNLMSQAADVERQGRQVPESLLTKLANIRTELALAKDLLTAREQEHQDTVARFDEDIATYTKGRALVEKNKKKN